MKIRILPAPVLAVVILPEISFAPGLPIHIVVEK